MSVGTGDDGGSDPGPGDSGDTNPIRVDPGKGWLVRLPVPREVLGKLGGPGRLEKRLRPIMDATPGQLTPDASDQLASVYDTLFEQLKAIPAERRDDGGGTDDPGNPVGVDPHQGRSVTLPVPEEVLAKLGGADHVGERLRPILDAAPGTGHALTPAASDELASAYAAVLQHLTAMSRPGQR